MSGTGTKRGIDHSSAFRLGARNPTLYFSEEEEVETECPPFFIADDLLESTGGNRSFGRQSCGGVPGLTPADFELPHDASGREVSGPVSSTSSL